VVKPALVALLSAVMVSAAESPPGESCATAQQHEFDFVIGNWLVRDSSGQAIGTATVAKGYGGCVLIETWLGVGSAGESLGVIGYLPASRRWHRDFLDPGGVVLSIEGRMEGAAMVMTGKDYPAEGVRMHRVSWTPMRDGAVEERWQTSTDAGSSWQVKFYGVFQRISE
jgi:hypothetical protein